ncbi:unnamed protein product [Chrysoparadoxa australica]
MDNRITESELRAHQSEEQGLWLSLSHPGWGGVKAVYDVTTLLPWHPGGAVVVEDCGGKDATKAFEEGGHGIKQLMVMDKDFLIGHLCTSGQPEVTPCQGCLQARLNIDEKAVPVVERCARCNAEAAEKLCSRCKMTRYCSRACQQAAWPSHKKTCIQPAQLF